MIDILGRRMEGYEVKENSIDLAQIRAGMYLLILDEKVKKIIRVCL